MQRDTTSLSLTATTRIALVEMPARPDAVWPLLGAYVELVWVEVLGLAATVIARRLGHLLDETPPTRGVSLDALAAPLHIPTSKALDSLRRLHHHRLIDLREHAAVIGCSRLAPGVPEQRVGELSSYTTRLLRQLELEQHGPVERPGRHPLPPSPRSHTIDL
ncbi:MAG: hypothetical protein ACRD0G_17750 [Acidimicrobiales bacterium]